MNFKRRGLYVQFFQKEKIKSKRQDVNPKLIRFKERLEKVKALEEKINRAQATETTYTTYKCALKDYLILTP